MTVFGTGERCGGALRRAARAAAWFAVIALGLAFGAGGAACAAAAPQVAVVMSSYNAAMYGMGYGQSVDQLKAILDEAGIAYKTVYASEVESGALQGYRLAILPLEACMSQQEVQQLINFVQTGGRLFATYQVATHDPQQNPQGDTLLAGVFKVSIGQWASAPGKYALLSFTDPSGPLAAGLPAFVADGRNATMIVEPLPGSQTAAVWYDADQKTPSGAVAIVTTPQTVYVADNIFDPSVAGSGSIRTLVVNIVRYLAPDVVPAR